MRQLVNIGIGQAGIQISQTLLQMYTEQHQLNCDGKRRQETIKNQSSLTHDRKSQNMSCLFQESEKSQLKARFMMIDSEPDVIDNFIHSEYKEFLNPFYLIAGKQSANTYAAGYHRLKTSHFDEIYENKFKKIAQSCDSLQGFLINHAIEGGTGSGTANLVMQILDDIFPKIQKTNFIINHDTYQSNTPIGPLNAILGLSHVQKHSDLLITVDNYALNKLFHRNLDVQSPNYKNLNSLISQIHSGYTLPMRFTNNKITCDIKQIQTNLVVFPRIKWILPSLVPLVNQQDVDKGWGNIFSSQFLVKKSLDRSCQLANQYQRGYQYGYSYHNHAWSLRYNYQQRTNFKKISSVLLGRGDINENQFIDKVPIGKEKIQFDDLNPQKIKVGISPQRPTRIHLNQTDKRLKNSITALTSTHEFGQIFIRINKNFDLIFSKKSFLHWFEKDGIGKDQFMQARRQLEDIQKDYQQWFDVVG